MYFVQDSNRLFKSIEAQRKYIVTDGGMTRRPNIKNYTVFVQSMGVGARPLFEGTVVLYDVCTCISHLWYIIIIKFIHRLNFLNERM